MQEPRSIGCVFWPLQLNNFPETMYLSEIKAMSVGDENVQELKNMHC